MISKIEAAVQLAEKMYDTQLGKAILIADTAHNDQMYGGVPYFNHLMEVDRLVVQLYANPSRGHSDPYSKEPGDEMDCLRAIAYLHDVIEDTEVSSHYLYMSGICKDVVEAVIAISKYEGQDYMAYLDVVCSNELARKVKICDTLANLMNSVKEGNIKRVNKYTNQYKLLNEGF